MPYTWAATTPPAPATRTPRQGGEPSIMGTGRVYICAILDRRWSPHSGRWGAVEERACRRNRTGNTEGTDEPHQWVFFGAPPGSDALVPALAFCADSDAERAQQELSSAADG